MKALAQKQVSWPDSINGRTYSSALGYAKGDYTYKFDFDVMKRFKLNKNQLPKTVYLNDPPSFMNAW